MKVMIFNKCMTMQLKSKNDILFIYHGNNIMDIGNIKKSKLQKKSIEYGNLFD